MGLDLAVVSFLSATLTLFSLPWHWRARNIATLSVIAWLVLCNITRGVHAIIWNGNVIVKYEIWCDITSKFIIGANVGLPACIVCINRYLAESASSSPAILNATNKRRRMIFELGMCVGFPIVIMALHYVVQGHRFDIIEDFGCNPALYMSVPAILIIYLPPLVLSLIALVYAGIALRWFVHRRAQFQTVLRVSGSGLTTDRYLRLIALSITEMTFATAMTLFVLVTNIDSGVQPWVSWEYVHEDWMRVGQIAKIQMPGRSWNIFLITWYIVPLTSVIFFAFFGFLQETIEEYRRVIDWARTRVLGGKSKQSPVLPVTKPEDSSIYKSAGVSFLEL